MSYISTGDIAARLIKSAAIGPSYDQWLVFFQAIGSEQSIRGMKYVFERRQSSLVQLRYHSVQITRGKWYLQTEPVEVQGISLHLLTGYIPRGAWGEGDKKAYFYISNGHPVEQANDKAFRMWAEKYTPYPIPPGLTVADVISHCFQKPCEGSGFVEPLPYALAITKKELESALKNFGADSGSGKEAENEA